MAVGLCPRCQRRFVIKDARSFERTCPACLRPMQMPDPAVLPAPAAMPSGVGKYRWLNGLPLSADEQGQRVLTALAEAAYQCDASRAQRAAAQERRGDTPPARTDGELPRSASTPGVAALRSPPKERPPGGPDLPTADLNQCAAVLIQEARTVCLDTKIVQARGRMLREDRRSSRDSLSLLPPMDYRLPPLAAGAAVPEAMSCPDERAVAPSCTTLYIWGYTPPVSLLCREQGIASAAAAEFAGEAGWEASREGAWAKAITVPGGLSEALREGELLLRQDPAVVGWGHGCSAAGASVIPSETAGGPGMILRLDLPDEAATVPLCRHVVRIALMDWGMGVEQVADIELVVSEATGNAIRHAGQHPGQRYQLTLVVEAARVRVTVVDQGHGFVRSLIEAPGLEQEGGRGLWLMEQLADTVTIVPLPGGGCRLEAEFFCPQRVGIPELP